MLPYLADRAKWPAIFLLAAACSFDGSGLVSAGATTTGSSTGAGSSSTGAPTTAPPTSTGTDGSASESATGTTSPVDPTTSTSTSTGPDLTTTDPSTGTTTGDTTTTTTTGSTTDNGTSTTTDASTGTSSTSTSSTGSSSGGSSSTGGDVCDDPGPEPNETEATAVDLGNQGCKADPKNFAGVLDGNTDVDWYHYHGVFSGMGCGMNDPDPVAAVLLTASDTVRICVFPDCDISGDTAFMCPGGTMGTMSPAGRAGCCGPASMNFVVNCVDGPNESAEVFVRLDQAPADACVDYDVDYSYKN